MRVLEGRILESIVQPFDVDGHRIEIATSIVISIYPGDDNHTNGLIRKADAALCQVTVEGRGTYNLTM